MRILHVETINNVAHGYAVGLARRGHSSTFYEPSLRGGGASPLMKLAHMPGRVWDLRRALGRMNRRACDVVHINWASYGILGLFSRVPYVVECHGRDVNFRARKPLHRLILGRIFRRAGAVLVITPDLMAPARTLRKDVILLPAAIDTEWFAPQPLPEPHRWTVFLFARLDSHKGAPTAVTALERFAKRHPDARILLVDYGPLSAEYQARYQGIFEFTPKVPPLQVREMIWQADVVVGQFFLGALGLSELQAMSCEKPVIVNYRYPDAFSTPPPVLDAQTADEIEAHLESLYQRRELGSELGARAREWVIAHHHTDVLAEQLERIYADVTK